jgi:hypothetical protein
MFQPHFFTEMFRPYFFTEMFQPHFFSEMFQPHFFSELFDLISSLKCLNRLLFTEMQRHPPIIEMLVIGMLEH